MTCCHQQWTVSIVRKSVAGDATEKAITIDPLVHTVAGVPAVAQSGNYIGSMPRSKTPNCEHDDRG